MVDCQAFARDIPTIFEIVRILIDYCLQNNLVQIYILKIVLKNMKIHNIVCLHQVELKNQICVTYSLDQISRWKKNLKLKSIKIFGINILHLKLLEF